VPRPRGRETGSPLSYKHRLRPPPAARPLQAACAETRNPRRQFAPNHLPCQFPGSAVAPAVRRSVMTDELACAGRRLELNVAGRCRARDPRGGGSKPSDSCYSRRPCPRVWREFLLVREGGLLNSWSAGGCVHSRRIGTCRAAGRSGGAGPRPRKADTNSRNPGALLSTIRPADVNESEST
jgi:hypothetical protein